MTLKSSTRSQTALTDARTGTPSSKLQSPQSHPCEHRAHALQHQDYLCTGTLGVDASASQAGVVLFIAYFLMVSGSRFGRKMGKIAGPTFAQKRATAEVLEEITAQIHRYLVVQMFTSALVGVGGGLAFSAVGLRHAAV